MLICYQQDSGAHVDEVANVEDFSSVALVHVFQVCRLGGDAVEDGVMRVVGRSMEHSQSLFDACLLRCSLRASVSLNVFAEPHGMSVSAKLAASILSGPAATA